jgi:hypothetical protein
MPHPIIFGIATQLVQTALTEGAKKLAEMASKADERKKQSGK